MSFVIIPLHSIAFIRHCSTSLHAGVPDLAGYQNFNREVSRSKTPAVNEFENRADLLNFMRDNPLPATVVMMDDTSLYTVDGIADVHVWDSFMESYGTCTLAIPIVSKQCVGWIEVARRT